MGKKLIMTGRQLREYIDRRVDAILNEDWDNWTPEDDDDIADYSFGMIAVLTTRSDMELGEDAITALQEVNEEPVYDEHSYVDVMVKKANVSCDEDGYCTITLECAITAPDMPIGKIEDETEERLWYWIEEKTGERLVSGFDWESEDTVFDRRVKNA